MKKDPHPGFTLRRYLFYNNFEPNKEGEKLPEYLWALRHTRRQAQHLDDGIAGNQYKPVYDMTTVRGVYSHGSRLCLSGECWLWVFTSAVNPRFNGLIFGMLMGNL